MQIKTAHIGILVNSMEKSVSFYENVMGFKKHHGFELTADVMEQAFGLNSPAKVEVLTCDAGAVELIMAKDTPQHLREAHNLGINHFAVEVEDLDKYVREIEDKDVKLKSFKKDDMTIWFAMDPDGVLIELKEIKR